MRTNIIDTIPVLLRRVLQLLGVLWSISGLGLSGCAIPPSVVQDEEQHVVRQRILAVAERLVGTPYVLGGESPQGVDCSGLVRYAYRQAGIEVPRTTLQQFYAAHPRQRVLPGDLVFFRTGQGDAITHVGIYVGHGQMIHASSSSRQVRKVSLDQRYWREHLVGGATFLVSRHSTQSVAGGGWSPP